MNVALDLSVLVSIDALETIWNILKLHTGRKCALTSQKHPVK
jgi:hypothetical protein